MSHDSLYEVGPVNGSWGRSRTQHINLIYFLVEEICGMNDFNCSLGNLHCIPWLWVCDGDVDCTDGSDESNATCG